MIKVLDQAALKLIDATIKSWDATCIADHPQAIHYIDCSALDKLDWYVILTEHPVYLDKCIEHNGFADLDGREWYYLLERYCHFEEACTYFNGWAMLNEELWVSLLIDSPKYAKYLPREWLYLQEYV